MLIWKNSYEIYVLQLEEQIISPYNYLVLVVLIWIVVHKNPEKERGDDHILKSFFFWLIWKLSLSFFIPALTFVKIPKIDREQKYLNLARVFKVTSADKNIEHYKKRTLFYW